MCAPWHSKLFTVVSFYFHFFRIDFDLCFSPSCSSNVQWTKIKINIENKQHSIRNLFHDTIVTIEIWKNTAISIAFRMMMIHFIFNLNILINSLYPGDRLRISTFRQTLRKWMPGIEFCHSQRLLCSHYLMVSPFQYDAIPINMRFFCHSSFGAAIHYGVACTRSNDDTPM